MPLLLRGFVGKVVIDEADVENTVGAANDVKDIGFALRGGSFDDGDGPAGRAVKLKDFKVLNSAESFNGRVKRGVTERDDNA